MTTYTLTALAVASLWVIALALCLLVAAVALVARNINVLQQELRYIFDLWQEHDTRWRQS